MTVYASLAALIAISSPQTEAGAARTYRRILAPGVEYHLRVETVPARLISALKFAPDAPFAATSALARDQVYDLSPENGRATLREMTETAQAAGGAISNHAGSLESQTSTPN